ncbi:hypothetical protein FB451DRAFT_1486170 [Mycena latifolia]|nr:hypothetical protein FB451DRAFT_1486170 [Mycena latifolia]
MQTTYQPTSFSSLAIEIRSDIWTRLPRQSKACILSVCQEWKVQAMGTPYLWTDLVFGETSTPNDLLIARRWIADSKKLQLTVTISQRPSATGSEQLTLPLIFEALSPVAERIKSLDITGPDSNANAVQSFMMQGAFPVLRSLAVMLQTHWLRTIRDGPTALSTLVHRPNVFYTLQLPVLSSLHLANIPAFWPASAESGTRLTEVVLGPQIREFCPTFPELHNVLRSTITLTHLGFYREIPGLDDSDAPNEIALPNLTSLSLRHVRPDSAQRLLSTLDIPNFTNLTIAFDRTEEAQGLDQLVEQLQLPATASKLQTLHIQSLPHPCDATFFALFVSLQTLGLDFSRGALSDEYWTAIAAPHLGGAGQLPMLQHVTLVDVEAIHAQELVLLRDREQQARLNSLELVLQEREALLTRKPRWSAWLRRNVDVLTITEYATKARYDRFRSSFTV